MGFGVSGELGATPIKEPVDNAFAYDLYRHARDVDAAEGRRYSDGATVLAGVKAAQSLGFISGTYRWCFTIDDVIDAIVRHSPVVIGIVWLDGMYETDERGLVDISGPEVGGHCIYVHGWWPNHPLFNDDMLVWQNSWGHQYGAHDTAGIPSGRGFVRASDMESLLKQDGEAVVLTDKRR